MPNMTSVIGQNNFEFPPQLKEAVKHWSFISPIVRHPRNKKDYDKLVSCLDALLHLVKGKEEHHLNGFIETISNLVSAYEDEYYPAPKIKGVEALKYLMEVHDLKQSDLSEIGSQGVISEILNGSRDLNLRQIKALSKRFHVDPSTFIDLEDQ